MDEDGPGALSVAGLRELVSGSLAAAARDIQAALDAVVAGFRAEVSGLRAEAAGLRAEVSRLKLPSPGQPTPPQHPPGPNGEAEGSRNREEEEGGPPPLAPRRTRTPPPLQALRSPPRSVRVPRGLAGPALLTRLRAAVPGLAGDLRPLELLAPGGRGGLTALGLQALTAEELRSRGPEVHLRLKEEPQEEAGPQSRTPASPQDEDKGPLPGGGAASISPTEASPSQQGAPGGGRPAKTFLCGVCGKFLRDGRSLSRHKKSHSAERPHGCGVCGRGFKMAATLKQHQKIHGSRERAFLCDVCCKMFLTGRQLQLHLRTHSQEKPYRCPDCGRGFTTRGPLTVHRRVHTGETPYRCPHCGWAFKRKTHLDNHLAVHTGARPFACGVCGKSCARRSYLTVHMRTHSGERPYRCALCEKAFTQSHCLKTHMKSHQPPPPPDPAPPL